MRTNKKFYAMKPGSKNPHSRQSDSRTYEKLEVGLKEYFYEAFGLGVFMISATFFTIVFEYPYSFFAQNISNQILRRGFIGVSMGLTAIFIIYSPWGKKSGAHINPSVTLAFLSLKKISLRHGLFYILSQIAGATLGMTVLAILMRKYVAHPSVNFVVTKPGPYPLTVVFAAEFSLSFLLMIEVLIVSNIKNLKRQTGLITGLLIAIFVTFESPISGMSLNPARTLASAIAAWQWQSLWIYFTAPPLGMSAAARIYLKFFGKPSHAKLHPG